MSSHDPQPALDAAIGKTYEFRGQQLRNTNAAMLALARLGYRLEDFAKKAHEMAPVVVYAMVRTPLEVYDALAQGSYERDAWAFYAGISPEESGQAMAIFTDCLVRFHDSMTRYTTEGAGKNLQAAADTQ